MAFSTPLLDARTGSPASRALGLAVVSAMLAGLVLAWSEVIALAPSSPAGVPNALV